MGDRGGHAAEGPRDLGAAGLSQGDPTQQSVRKLRPGPVAATRPQGLSPPSRPPSHMQPRGRVRTPWGAHQVRGARVLAPRHPYNHPLSQRPMRAYFTDEETEAKGRGVQLWPLPAPSAARHVWGAARGARPPPTCVTGGGVTGLSEPRTPLCGGRGACPQGCPRTARARAALRQVWELAVSFPGSSGGGVTGWGGGGGGAPGPGRSEGREPQGQQEEEPGTRVRATPHLEARLKVGDFPEPSSPVSRENGRGFGTDTARPDGPTTRTQWHQLSAPRPPRPSTPSTPTPQREPG